MKHISKILAAGLLAGTVVVAAPAPSAQAADKPCSLGGKLWAPQVFGKGGSVAYARNWWGNPRKQPSYNGITYMSGYYSNGGRSNLDSNGRAVRWGLRAGQASKGYNCTNLRQGWPAFHDVDGIWVPAGWWVRIETLQSNDPRNPNKTWRYWRNLPGTSTGRWYKLNGPTTAYLGRYKVAWAWRS